MKSNKRTQELEQILGQTHISDFRGFLKDQKEEILPQKEAFGSYIKEYAKQKKLMLYQLFQRAEIPERYGYRILLGERHTRQRDIILRICYAAGLDLEQTQKALRMYQMAPLYVRIPRDALLMLLISERPGDISRINELLQEQGFETLKTCGEDTSSTAQD